MWGAPRMKVRRVLQFIFGHVEHCVVGIAFGSIVTASDAESWFAKKENRNCKLPGYQAAKYCNLKSRKAPEINSHSIG